MSGIVTTLVDGSTGDQDILASFDIIKSLFTESKIRTAQSEEILNGQYLIIYSAQITRKRFLPF